MDNTIVETAIQRLHALAETNPALQEAVNFYQRLIPAVNDLCKEVPGLVIDQQILRQKLMDGIPLLVGEMLEFDANQSQRIIESIGAVVQSTGSDANDARQKAREIQDAIERGDLDPLHIIHLIASGETAQVSEIAFQLDLDTQMLEMLAHNTLKVFLRAWRGMLEQQVDLESWRRSQCPFCGADAALAEIRGVEGARFLRCLRCGAGWPYPNLQCAYCCNADHKSLGILMVDQQTRRSYIHTCDHCKRYIKTIVTFDPIPTDLLIIEDLATLQLDYLAAEIGYTK